MNHNKDFDIVKLIELVRYKKYETTVAGFSVIDKLERVPIPKKWKSRKIAIQAMYALSEGLVRYKYLTKDEKHRIAEEVSKRSQALPSRAQNLFAPTNAPLSSEETEEEELPLEETSFQADYVDDRYNEESMQEESDDYEYEDEEEEDE